MNTQITISGFLVGDIWMPNCECWKDLNYDLTREDQRFTEPGTLRDHILRATNDGDFQSCAIAQGELTITRRDGRKTVSRSFPLDMFPSIADCLHDNPEWFPNYPDDDD